MGFTGRSTTGPQQYIWAGETQHCSPEAGFVHKGKKILQGKAPLLENCSAQVHHLQEVGGQEGTDR